MRKRFSLANWPFVLALVVGASVWLSTLNSQLSTLSARVVSGGGSGSGGGITSETDPLSVHTGTVADVTGLTNSATGDLNFSGLAISNSTAVFVGSLKIDSGSMYWVGSQVAQFSSRYLVDEAGHAAIIWGTNNLSGLRHNGSMVYDWRNASFATPQLFIGGLKINNGSTNAGVMLNTGTIKVDNQFGIKIGNTPSALAGYVEFYADSSSNLWALLPSGAAYPVAGTNNVTTFTAAIAAGNSAGGLGVPDFGYIGVSGGTTGATFNATSTNSSYRGYVLDFLTQPPPTAGANTGLRAKDTLIVDTNNVLWFGFKTNQWTALGGPMVRATNAITAFNVNTTNTSLRGVILDLGFKLYGTPTVMAGVVLYVYEYIYLQHGYVRSDFKWNTLGAVTNEVTASIPISGKSWYVLKNYSGTATVERATSRTFP